MSTGTRARSQRTVLVVDDEESVRQLIVVMLELEGHRVLEADCGAKALEVVAAHHVDLITLDVMMPDLDGWEVAERLDGQPATSSIPRLMVSGMPLHQLNESPGATRAAAVLAKPFDFAEFVSLVQLLLATPLPVPEPRAG
jgi:CheY-like chemotaxis protein